LLTSGNVHDSKPACEFINACSATAILADKAYGSKAILGKIAEKQRIAVIHPKRN